jgi:hypothetical protein
MANLPKTSTVPYHTELGPTVATASRHTSLIIFWGSRASTIMTQGRATSNVQLWIDEAYDQPHPKSRGDLCRDPRGDAAALADRTGTCWPRTSSSTTGARVPLGDSVANEGHQMIELRSIMGHAGMAYFPRMFQDSDHETT